MDFGAFLFGSLRSLAEKWSVMGTFAVPVPCVLRSFADQTFGYISVSQAYNEELKVMLNEPLNDATIVPEMGESKPSATAQQGGVAGSGSKGSGGSGASGKRKAVPLEELTRFTMVKRIW